MNDMVYKKALDLEYFTIGYDVIEVFLSIFFCAIAGSIDLIEG